MNFYTVLAARPQYYDRNPLDVIKSYNQGSIAPHAATSRWTYTVPSARKAFVSMLDVFVIRDSTATTASFNASSITVTPSGGSQTTVLQVIMYNVTVDANRGATLGGNATLLAGDLITAFTQDSDTGGTAAYNVAAMLTEFDA